MDQMPATVKKNNGESQLVPRLFTETSIVEYFRGLFEWADPLSMALRALPLEEGTIRGFVPEGFHLARPKDIEWNHEQLRGRGQEARSMAEQFVTEFLVRSSSAVGLFQAIQVEGDPSVSKLTVPYAYFAPTDPEKRNRRMMVLFLTKGFADDDHVSAAFRQARPFTFLTILTRQQATGEKIKPGVELSTHTVSLLAAATEHLIAEAFDGDSYFVWSRRA